MIVRVKRFPAIALRLSVCAGTMPARRNATATAQWDDLVSLPGRQPRVPGADD
jgi:hypothetical protein